MKRKDALAELIANAKWKWWVGRCEERFYEECDTREHAVEIALNHYDGDAWIVEAVKADNVQLSAYFGTDQFLEDAEDRAYDLGDPEAGGATLFEVTPDQGSDLEAMVRAAIDAWQVKHSLKFVPWAFDAQRNLEYICAPDTEVSET